MKRRHPWSDLKGLWQPRHAVPPAPATDLVVTSVMQIRRTLNELAHLESPLALHAANGLFLGGGLLAIEGAQGLVVHQRLHDTPHASGNTTWPLNVTASSNRGLVNFMLQPRTPVSPSGPGAPRLLRAAWPDQLTHVQSRRHPRLAPAGSLSRRAWLSRPGSATQRMPVRDISEEGVGLEVPAYSSPGTGYLGQALLHLDNETISIPLLEVVHIWPGPAGGTGTVGARLLGLSAEQVQTLRRWMAGAQADQAGDAMP